MTALTREVRASYAFVERNFFLTRRYWGWEVAFLIYSVAGALSVSLDRGRPGQYAPAAVADDRRDLLELPLRGVQLDRRHDRRRALGGHARVHDDGARSARHPAARVDVLRRDLRPDPHGRDPRRDGAVLPAARSQPREPAGRGGVHRRSDRSASWASAWSRRSCRCSTSNAGADDVRHPVGPAADQRRLLFGQHPAAVDAGALASVPGHVCAGCRPGRNDRRARRRFVGRRRVPLVVMGIVFIPLGLWAFGGRSGTRSGPES